MNRTDQNQQYFEIELSEDLDLIQVLSHKVYHFERKAEAFDMKSYDDYLNLTSNPLTLKIFETYP